MSALYTTSRILVAFLGFTALLGVLWFADSLDRLIVVATVLLGLSSLAAAFVSQRKLSSGTIRRTLITLCVVAIATGLVLVADNLSASHAIEWHVVSINLLHIAAVAVMATRALTWTSEPKAM